MALVNPGFSHYEKLAAIRFQQSLDLALKVFGVKVEVLRRSVSEPEGDIESQHTNAASRVYQIGSALGKPDNLIEFGMETEPLSIGKITQRFPATIVASHHLYASADQDFLTDFEEIYFFTQDDIRPDDNILFIREIDNLRKGFRVIDSEIIGTQVSSTEDGKQSRRLKMSALVNPATTEVLND